MPLIRALRKSDGRKVVIPEHWLDNPKLGAAFKRHTAPTPKAADSKATTKKEND